MGMGHDCGFVLGSVLTLSHVFECSVPKTIRITASESDRNERDNSSTGDR
jgi:hypothetical protein